jgi:hypothetical protein
MSHEHVFPEWLSKAGVEGGYYTLKRGDKSLRTELIEVTTKRVCEDCNTGWLSRIETETQPIFTGLMGRAQKISPHDRWALARWFTKTILTAQLALTARSQAGILHPDNYATFFSHAQPFQNQFTLLAGYQGPLLPIRFEVNSPEEATNRGVRVFFQFHHIVILASFMDMEKPSTLHLPLHFSQACVVLWPPQRGLLGSGDPTLAASWPPPLLDAAGVNAVIEAFLG